MARPTRISAKAPGRRGRPTAWTERQSRAAVVFRHLLERASEKSITRCALDSIGIQAKRAPSAPDPRLAAVADAQQKVDQLKSLLDPDEWAVLVNLEVDRNSAREMVRSGALDIGVAPLNAIGISGEGDLEICVKYLCGRALCKVAAFFKI
jgi:hypothetical protein